MKLGPEEERLYEELEGEGADRRVLDAMKRAKRALFVPAELRGSAYANEPLPIGKGQTISQPSIVAFMTSELSVREGDSVLEVGAGSGWQAAILKELAGPEGKVTSIERLPEVAEFAIKNLKKAGYDVEVRIGDGSLGWGKGKYDRIMVTAGAPRIPEALVAQLKEGGKMVIPVGDRQYQELVVAEKSKLGLKMEKKGGCVFVPLVGGAAWKLEQ